MPLDELVVCKLKLAIHWIVVVMAFLNQEITKELSPVFWGSVLRDAEQDDVAVRCCYDVFILTFSSPSFDCRIKDNCRASRIKWSPAW